MPQSETQGYSLKIDTGPKFGFVSDPDFVFMGEDDIGLIKSAVFVDDMFDYFPAAQMNISDQAGDLIEKRGFVEGLNMKIELSDQRTRDSVYHNFYWADTQLSDTLLSDKLSGTSIWRLISKYKKDDSIKSKAWGISSSQGIGVNIKTPIKAVADNYKFEKSIIKGVNAGGVPIPGEGPQNNDLFYQANILDFDFMRNNLMQVANDDTNSPYISFVNLQREFYFTTIADLESQQVDDSLRFRMETSAFQTLEGDQINRYMVQHGGSPLNQPNYGALNFNFTVDGAFSSSSTNVRQFFKAPKIQSNEIGNSKDRKFFLRKQNVGTVRSVHDYGIVDNDLQKRNVQGRIANRHVNSMTSNRIVVVVPFRAKAAAGRTVELDFSDGRVGKFSRYAGKWTILRTEHHWNGKVRKLTDKLTLFRSGMDIPKDAGVPFTFIASDF